MKKMKLISAVLTFSACPISIGVFTFAQKNVEQLLNNAASITEEDYKIHINSSIFANSESVFQNKEYKLNDFASLTFSNARYKESSICEMKEGSYIVKTNNEASYNLKSIRIVYEGDLVLYTSCTSDGFDQFYDIESDVNYSLEGNYFKIIAKENTVIKSIDLVYGCYFTQEVIPGQNQISLKNNKNYAYLEKKNNKLDFIIEGSYSNSLPRKTQFEIKDQNTNKALSCYEVEILKNNVFKAYFDIESYFANQEVTIETLYPILYIDGQYWNNRDGILIVGQEGAYYKPSSSYLSTNEEVSYSCGYVNESYPRTIINSYRHVNISLLGDDYASVSYKEDKEYFTIKGQYQGNYTLVKESLYFKDNNRNKVEAANLTLTHNGSDVTSFVLEFDVSNCIKNASNQQEGRRSENVEPHLYLNDNYYNGSSSLGRIYNDTTCRSQNATYKNRNIRISHFENNTGFLVGEMDNISFRPEVTVDTAKSWYPLSLYKEGEDLIYKVSGHFPGTYGNYAFDKSIIELFDGDRVTPCFKLDFENPGADYEGGTRFIAYFKINESLFDADGHMFSHIRFNGNPFDSANGDLKPTSFKDDPSDGSWIKKGDSVSYNSKTYSLYSWYHMAVLEVK